MRLNFYILIFVLTDVAAFAFVNLNFAGQDDFFVSLLTRMAYTSFFVFVTGNTLLWFEDLFKSKIQILICTYLLGYMLLLLLIGSFSNKPGNIIQRIIDLHTVPGSLKRLLFPYLFSFALNIGLFSLFNYNWLKTLKTEKTGSSTGNPA